MDCPSLDPLPMIASRWCLGHIEGVKVLYVALVASLFVDESKTNLKLVRV